MVNNVREIDWKYLGKIKELGSKWQQIYPSQVTKDSKRRVQAQNISGIYVWILPEKDNTKTVFYVGQSTGIWRRLEQEVQYLLGGAWSAYELPQQNFTEFLLDRFYDKATNKAIIDNINCLGSDYYSPMNNQTGSIAAYLDERRIRWAKNMLENIEIAIAIITDPETKDEKRKLRDAEAYILNYLYNKKGITKYPRQVKAACYGDSGKHTGKNYKHKGDIKLLPGEIQELARQEQTNEGA